MRGVDLGTQSVEPNIREEVLGCVVGNGMDSLPLHRRVDNAVPRVHRDAINRLGGVVALELLGCIEGGHPLEARLAGTEGRPVAPHLDRLIPSYFFVKVNGVGIALLDPHVLDHCDEGGCVWHLQPVVKSSRLCILRKEEGKQGEEDCVAFHFIISHSILPGR